jgi:uncharacterized protein (TIGR04255 family)
VPVRLDQPDRTPLVASPLTLVVFQLRFETNAAASDARVARDFHERLGGRQGRYPVIEPVTNFSLQVAGAPGQEPSVSQRASMAGWRFRSEDSSWVASLLSDAVSLETTQYDMWDSFRDRLNELIAVLRDLVNPVFEQRLGLRFVNQVTIDGVLEPAAWEPWVNSFLLGPALHPQLREGLIFSRQQLALDIGDETSCSLAHGSFPQADGQGLAYLLDYDVYRQTGRPFVLEDVIDTATRFNDVALALFHLSVTQEYLDLAGSR